MKDVGLKDSSGKESTFSALELVLLRTMNKSYISFLLLWFVAPLDTPLKPVAIICDLIDQANVCRRKFTH